MSSHNCQPLETAVSAGNGNSRPERGDRRTALRKSSKLLAVIKLPDGQRRHAAIINDSAAGALLELTDIHNLPACFEVQMSSTGQRRARVARCEANRIAIEYF